MLHTSAPQIVQEILGAGPSQVTAGHAQFSGIVIVSQHHGETVSHDGAVSSQSGSHCMLVVLHVSHDVGQPLQFPQLSSG